MQKMSLNRLTSIALIIASLSSVAACSSLRFPGVYRIDVAQGNLITKDMVGKLKVGMTPRQVEFVMGSPMIADTFHQDRWDYLYWLETGKGYQVENRLTLHFENERLARIDDQRYQHPDKVREELLNKMGVPEQESTLKTDSSEEPEPATP